MSLADDNKSTGTLGEGTGIRDDPEPEKDAEVKKSVQMIDDLAYDDLPKSKHEHHKDKDVKTKRDPLILIGKNGTTGILVVRCHNCGTSRGEEDRGTFIQVNKYIAWFHNKDCFVRWAKLCSRNYETGAEIDQLTGEEIIEKDSISI